MKNVTRNVAFVSALVALASLGSAQVLNGAANAAGRVNVPAVQPPPPPPPPPVTPPPPPSVSAGATAGAASSAATAIRTPVMPATAGAGSSVRGGGNASATGVNASAASQASAQGQANGSSVAAAVPSQASVTVNTADTVHTIQVCTFAARDSVTTEVQARLDASVQQCAAMQAKAEAAGEKSREAFAKALVEVRKQEKELRTSLRAAAKASGEKAWGETQSALAHDYGAYAEAVAHAEAAAQGSGEVSATPKS